MNLTAEAHLEWPDTQTGGGREAPKWNIKTEDEEYLERLENKLARLQKDGPKPQPASRHASSDISSFSEVDSEDNEEDGEGHSEIEQPEMKDDDAGLHLLHDVEQPSQSFPEDSESHHASRDQSPENALHLRLGKASRQTSESSSRSGFPSNSAEQSSSALGVAPPPEETKSRPFPFRVRFRSRVRIGSGIRHNRSRTSLDSSSPSSSISAPLRYSSYEGSDQGTSYAQLISDVASGLGSRQLSSTLSGTAHSPYATGKKFRRYGSAPAAVAPVAAPGVDERTPLFAANDTRSYGHERRPSLSQIPDSDAEGDDQAQRDARLRRSLQQAPRKSEEEVMFGRWPWRLFNGHWWLWKLEPICGCCYTDDDTDSDLD
ncbi:hypothetical protein SCHPADRAFT_999037 [Schizopora paradoxa]|uniref:Uncharacterized protein n=1 Tax=Schizopora paradoxa TaxID=27342 RepID=A0A0H2RP84_9AGAM|nr:hypothetical protein SCHPADRAFT_999037 [Schizopora paradoxa]